jgi:hypothetical protein
VKIEMVLVGAVVPAPTAVHTNLAFRSWLQMVVLFLMDQGRMFHEPSTARAAWEEEIEGGPGMWVGGLLRNPVHANTITPAWLLKGECSDQQWVYHGGPCG